MVYGCDICQDVCPWNRGVEKRRRGEAPPHGAEPSVSLAEWLEADGEELVRRYERLYVPKNDPRWLRRNALVALGNSGGRRMPRSPSRTRGDDELLREHAEWALARLRGERHRELRAAAAGANAGSPGSASARCRSPRSRRCDHHRLPARPRGLDLGHDRACSPSAPAVLWWLAPPASLRARWRASGSAALAFDFLIVSSFVLALTFVRATPIRQVLILVLIEAAFRYGIVGGLGFVVANVPTLIAYEGCAPTTSTSATSTTNITLQVGVR